MLRQNTQGVDDQFRLGQPDGARLRDTERTADHPNIDIVQFVGATLIVPDAASVTPISTRRQ